MTIMIGTNCIYRQPATALQEIGWSRKDWSAKVVPYHWNNLFFDSCSIARWWGVIGFYLLYTHTASRDNIYEKLAILSKCHVLGFIFLCSNFPRLYFSNRPCVCWTGLFSNIFHFMCTTSVCYLFVFCLGDERCIYRSMGPRQMYIGSCVDTG